MTAPLNQFIVHLPPDRVEVREAILPAMRDDEVVVAAELTAISPGTELRTLRTRTPGEPFVPGYCVVGQVWENGARTGPLVICPGGRLPDGLTHQWGGHQRFHVVPRRALEAVPAGLSVAEVALFRLAAIAYRGFALAKPPAGTKTLVIGLGMIGQAAARIWQAHGCPVTACDRVATRVEAASRGGAVGRLVTGSLADAARDGGPFDAVVDCTGVPQVVTDGLALLRQDPWDEGWRSPSPLYVVQGSYAGEVRFDYRPAFNAQASVFFPRDNTTVDRQAVLAMLAAGQLRLDDVLTHVVAPADAAQAYTELARPDTSWLGTAIRW